MSICLRFPLQLPLTVAAVFLPLSILTPLVFLSGCTGHQKIDQSETSIYESVHRIEIQTEKLIANSHTLEEVELLLRAHDYETKVFRTDLDEKSGAVFAEKTFAFPYVNSHFLVCVIIDNGVRVVFAKEVVKENNSN